MTVRQPLPTQPSQSASAQGAPPAQPAARKRGSRLPFWAGFGLGFLALAIVTLVVAWFALGFDSVTLAQLRGDNEGWTPPTLMPTPTPAPIRENDEPLITVGGRFQANQTVRNVTGSRVNLRRTPGHLGKGNDDILGQLAAGDAVVIQGESTVVDNLTWWLVSWQGQQGWVAEATASGVQILGE